MSVILAKLLLGLASFVFLHADLHTAAGLQAYQEANQAVLIVEHYLDKGYVSDTAIWPEQDVPTPSNASGTAETRQ